KAWRWCRRNPAAAALIATVFLSLVGSSAGAIAYMQDRAGRKAHAERAVEVALHEANTLRERAWELTETPHLWESTLAAALSAIKRAEALVADAGNLVAGELHERVRDVRADLDADERDRQFVSALEQIRLEDQINVKESRFAIEEAIPKYREAFRSYGL